MTEIRQANSSSRLHCSPNWRMFSKAANGKSENLRFGADILGGQVTSRRLFNLATVEALFTCFLLTSAASPKSRLNSLPKTEPLVREECFLRESVIVMSEEEASTAGNTEDGSVEDTGDVEEKPQSTSIKQATTSKQEVRSFSCFSRIFYLSGCCAARLPNSCGKCGLFRRGTRSEQLLRRTTTSR